VELEHRVNCLGCTFYDGVGIHFFSKTKKVWWGA